MKHLVVPVLSAALALNAYGADALKVGVDAPYPPFEFKAPDGTLTGFEIELGNEVCKEITGKNCMWVIQSWNGIIPGLQSGKYDMIFSSMSITKEREKQLLFSEPYYSIPSVFFAVDKFDPNNAVGKRIGVQLASSQDTYVTKIIQGAEPVRYEIATGMVQDIKAGRLDAMFLDARVGFDMIEPNFNITQVGAMIREPVSVFGEGVGAAFRKDDIELEEKVSAALAKVKANGKYDQIMRKYFDFDIKR